MRFIPTSVHGLVDYLVGALLIAAPWVLNFYQGGAESYVPIVLGISVIVYSLLTRYEWGALRVLPMPVHLWLDGLGGALLAASPWLFQFSDHVWIPHVVVGLGEILAALCTSPRPAGISHPRDVSSMAPMR